MLYESSKKDFFQLGKDCVFQMYMHAINRLFSNNWLFTNDELTMGSNSHVGYQFTCYQWQQHLNYWN